MRVVELAGLEIESHCPISPVALSIGPAQGSRVSSDISSSIGYSIPPVALSIGPAQGSRISSDISSSIGYSIPPVVLSIGRGRESRVPQIVITATQICFAASALLNVESCSDKNPECANSGF